MNCPLCGAETNDDGKVLTFQMPHGSMRVIGCECVDSENDTLVIPTAAVLFLNVMMNDVEKLHRIQSSPAYARMVLYGHSE